MAMALSTRPAMARALKSFLPLTSAFLDMKAKTIPSTPQIRPVEELLLLIREAGK